MSRARRRPLPPITWQWLVWLVNYIMEAALRFDAGTITVEGLDVQSIPRRFKWDARVAKFRAPAMVRRAVVQSLSRDAIAVADGTSAAHSLDLRLRTSYAPRPYQEEALESWVRAGGCGTVILPTGAGKTFVALGAIAEIERSTLVVAPTIDLMSQWYSVLSDAFSTEVGLLGGGYREIRELTVSTYESAYILAAEYGNRFDLIVFDEVHHLPSPKFRQIPEMSTAWWRLGLTATYERQDASHRDLEHLIGPVVYRKRVHDLKGEYLADYAIVRIATTLTEDESRRYEAHAAVYYPFVRKTGIKPHGQGWEEFVRLSARNPEARSALIARQQMRRIVFGSERKLEALEALLKQHCGDKVIVFTEHNELVYRISREFLIPAITHQTATRERKWILDGFREGMFSAIVTSKVLNEGIDVPSAKVAIILSGSASPREYLQRLGRILRKSGERRTALLYEVVTSATSETGISSRRRKGHADA